MVIKKAKYFHLKIEDVKWSRNDKGDVYFSEWTGYGPITVPFGKTVFLKRGTRKPVFTMLYKKNRVLEIDIREYLRNHLDYIHDKQVQQVQKDKQQDNVTTSFTDFEKGKSAGDQLSLF